MPRVPRLTAPQVAPIVQDQPVASPSQMPGAGLAQGIERLSAQVGQMAEQARRRGLEIRRNELEVQARRLANRILSDPQSGVLNRQRQAAFDADQVALDQWRQGVDAMLTDVRDPELRQAVELMALDIGSRIEEQALRHVRKQMDVVDKEQFDALRVELTTEAITNAANPQAVTENITRIESLVRERLRRQDVTDPQVIETALREARSSVRVAQTQALLANGDIGTARAVYDATADEMDAQYRTRLGEAITQAEQGASIQQAAVKILASSDSPTERNQMIAALPIGMRKGVRDLVEAEQRAEKQARELEQEGAFARVEQAVVNGVPLTAPQLAGDLALLSTSQRKTLDNYTMAPTNDNAAWLEWYQLATDPKALAEMTESQFRSHWVRLSTSHRDDAERDYRKAKQTANAPESSRSYITPQTVIARAMRTVGGIEPFAPLSQIPKQKQAMVAQFETRAAEEMAAEVRAKGRDLTPTEMQTVVDRMQLQFVREVARDPVRFGETSLTYGVGRRRREEAMAFQMTPADTTGIFAGATRITMESIPTDALPGVDNILRANNIPVTDRNREALYTIQRFDTDGSRTTRWLNDNRR